LLRVTTLLKVLLQLLVDLLKLSLRLLAVLLEVVLLLQLGPELELLGELGEQIVGLLQPR
jgi:hypothetical protein